MSEALFEYLASFGFKKFGNGIPDLVQQMNRKTLVEFSQGAEVRMQYAEARARTPFEFSASETFAGAPTPCASVSCRMDRVRELAYFAALYADRVLIASPFTGIDSDAELWQLRREVVAGVASCLYLKPLLEGRLIEYTRPRDGNVCLDCYAKLAGKQAEEWQRLRTNLEREYRERVEYYLERMDRMTYAVPEGPADLFDEHTTKPLQSVPKAMRKFVRGEGRWRIPAPVVDELKLAKEYSDQVAEDLLGRDLCAARFGTGYLTRREIDLRVIRTQASQADDRLLDRDLSHEVPTLIGAAPSDLMKLRHEETDAFKTYQLALRRAATESVDSPANLSEIFRDVVAPEIRRMDAALAAARGTLVRGLAADVTSATAFVSLAFFSGLFPLGVATALTGIGGIHFTDKIADKLSKLFKQEPDHARENPFYFLWKASKGAKRATRRRAS